MADDFCPAPAAGGSGSRSPRRRPIRSSRYGGGEIRDEARSVFERTVVPRDFDTIDVPYAEKGEPELVRWDNGRTGTVPA